MVASGERRFALAAGEALLCEVRRHRKWLGLRLDGERVAWCETALKWSQSAISSSLLRIAWLFLICNLALMGPGILSGLMLAFG